MRSRSSARSCTSAPIHGSGDYGEPTAFLYPNDQLFVGGYSTYPFPVDVTGVSGAYRLAKLAPDGRLWLVTEDGLFRSNAPVALP